MQFLVLLLVSSDSVTEDITPCIILVVMTRLEHPYPPLGTDFGRPRTHPVGPKAKTRDSYVR